MAIHLIRIRAKIEIGSLDAGTPPLGYDNHILSFNVDMNRGKPSTFNASLKVKHSDVSGTITGDYIRIYSGTSSDMPLIYTGIVKAVNMTPCREDPGFVILNLSGEDILSRLQGKKFTRRCRSSRGLWVGIEGVARPGLRSGEFEYVANQPWIGTVGADVTEVGSVTKTKNIPSFKETAENVPMDTEGIKEASLDIEPVEPVE
jgi:hypothetical protein